MASVVYQLQKGEICADRCIIQGREGQHPELVAIYHRMESPSARHKSKAPCINTPRNNGDDSGGILVSISDMCDRLAYEWE